MYFSEILSVAYNSEIGIDSQQRKALVAELRAIEADWNRRKRNEPRATP
jgi:hypothetical protein